MESKRKDRCLFLSSLLFLCFIFDSGGNIGIRNMSFLIVGLLVLIQVIKNKIFINKSFFLFYLVSLTYLLVNLLIALINGVSFFSANIFNFSLYFLIIAYFLAHEKYLTLDGYLVAIKVFSVFILFFFFGRILGFLYSFPIFDKLSPYGGINAMKNGMPSVYYQGTLAIVPATVMFARKRCMKWFFICLLTLAVAPSRFGVFTSMFLFLVIYRRKLYIPLIIAIFILILLSAFNITIPALFDFLDMFDRDSYGTNVRFEHLKSLIILFKNNPLIFLFGQGPGAVFYTSGFHGYTDSIEISHFDFVRKYGVFYFMFLNIGLLLLILKLNRKKTDEARLLIYGLIAHYIVAISNPVLSSLPFIMLLSICIISANKSIFNKERGR